MKTNADYLAEEVLPGLTGGRIVATGTQRGYGCVYPVLHVLMPDGQHVELVISSDAEGNDGGWVTIQQGDGRLSQLTA